ncbi:peroxiredoxin [Oikeobacillus pervagus]|uniref:Peroxiredoxin n=1 Tax=Oikeobacillus pervagus TaxID=1325931 RepID=A0AAJ1SW91_9BACI|nr:thiol-disulfide oxidoreductase ResA [Oikeobacillus pervagus]MDQ0213739.1 peroxiredoxin [Oikeobacillus pervagus]
MEKKKKRLMIRTIILAILVLAVGYTLYSNLTQQSKGKITEGEKAPDFVLTDLDGKEHHLSDYKGKGVFLNFWGTWCEPCKAEMPYMEKLYPEYKKQGVEILAVNVGESNFQVKKFVEQFELTFPVVIDEKKEVQKDYNIVPIPTTFLINSEGEIVNAKPISKSLTEEEIRGLLDQIKP